MTLSCPGGLMMLSLRVPAVRQLRRTPERLFTGAGGFLNILLGSQLAVGVWAMALAHLSAAWLTFVCRCVTDVLWAFLLTGPMFVPAVTVRAMGAWMGLW